MRIMKCFWLGGLLAVWVGWVGAQNYPQQPIKLIQPFAPGAASEVALRIVAERLSVALKTTVLIENRPGAGSTLGADSVAKATADGHTLLASYNSSIAPGPLMYAKIPYDPINDITPISLIGETGFLVALHPNVPAKTVKELITLARSKSGGLNYGSTGTGGITHLATELFDIMAGTRMTHVPYKGTGPAMADLLGGQIQLVFGAMPAMVPQHKAGRLRGIAVTTGKRIPTIPDIPTVGETLSGYEAAYHNTAS